MYLQKEISQLEIKTDSGFLKRRENGMNRIIKTKMIIVTDLRQ